MRPPRVIPVTLVLGLVLCFFATTGGQELFVNEMLSEAYDSQGEHFLRGDVDVDGDAIRHEALVVDGKARMYFGPFPAFLRMPLNALYPAGRGQWSRVSGIAAGLLALFAFAGLIRDALRASPLSQKSRDWLGHACIAGFAFGSPLPLLLGNLSIYNEAIVWGLAWSVAAIFFGLRARAAQGTASSRWFLAFSISAGGALLSRLTFGAPLILMAAALAVPLVRARELRGLTALCLPLGAALAFSLLLSYARFGTLSGVDFNHYINPDHREFVREHGTFDLRRLPATVSDYFGGRLPNWQSQAPFLRADRHHADPTLFSLPLSEVFLPMPWVSGWLLVGAALGIFALCRRGGLHLFEWWTAAAFFAQMLAILSYFALAQRYSADFYPFLIFCLALYLRTDDMPMLKARHIIVVLVAVAIVVNPLATLSWTVEAEANVRPDTRAIWLRMLGRDVP